MTPTTQRMYGTQREYDVIVVGGGPVGENAADRAGRTGLSVVLVEAELLGGECSYWACMPSKTLLRPGAARDAARRVPGLTPPDAIDPQAVLRWRDEMVGDWTDAGGEEWLASAGIDLVRGHGRITGVRTVEVGTTDGGTVLLTARHAVVVATGSIPVLPEIPGLADVDPWSTREATATRSVPRSLAVIGGGVVATEMATAYADLGAEVTVLSRGPLLARLEPFAGEAVARALTASGIDVRLGASVEDVETVDDGIRLTLSDRGKSSTVTADKVLVATGRAPRTADLGVESLGLVPGEGLQVDESMLVGAVPGGWLFAAGDVTGRAFTTHQGKYEARVAGDVIAARFGVPAGSAGTENGVAGGGKASSGSEDALGAGRSTGDTAIAWTRFTATADHRASTQAIFTRPEIATVGLTEQEARDARLDVTVVRRDLSTAAGSAVMGNGYDGVAQIVVDNTREVIVGATFVGPDAAEMLHAATIAVVGEVPMRRLWHAVPAFPTVSEVWLRLLEGYGL